VQAKPVDKTIGGVTFEDRFAHLQDDTPEALEWQWARDARARAKAESSPNFGRVRDRLIQLGDAPSIYVPRKRGPYWFVLAQENGDTVVRASAEPNGPGRTIVSGRAISEIHGGGELMMAWIAASPHGRFVAAGWGLDGDMFGTWSIYETESGRHVLDTPAVLYSGARPGWLPDESGFWLDGRNEEGLHYLRFVPVLAGTAERCEINLPEHLVEAKHSGLTPQVSPDGRRAIVVTEPHEHVALVYIDLDTLEARRFLPESFEGECDGSWVDGDTYVARVNSGEPKGRVVAVPAASSQDMATWRELVPAGDGFIGWAGIVAGRLYVGDFVDVSMRVRVFDLDGNLLETLPLEGPGSSPAMFLERAIRPTDVFAFNHATFTRSAVMLVHDSETAELRQIGHPKFQLNGVEAEQHFAISKDGARIPYFVVRRSDLAPVPQPTLVHAYGGFNISMLPTFATNFVPFIEAGGVFVQASLRGGSEYGKAWHDAGRLFNKRNTFDDLEAVAKALIAEGISIPERMAFQGASNGGLLAGAAIVYQPHLWRAVAPVVPVFDIMEMLPLTPATAGIRAIMYEDYGDTENPEVARSVIAWSPYHNIKDGVTYPAVYQVFGEFDVGCMPFHGRKFTARLDEANNGDRPIELRVWRNTGHGVLDPETSAAYTAEWLAFLMDEVGLKAADLSVPCSKTSSSARA